MKQFRVDRESGVVVLTAEGELDAYTAPGLTESLEAAGLDDPVVLVADLSRVSFLDSTALGLLVRTVNEVLHRGGRAKVVLPNTTARRIFEITTLDRVLPVAPTRADALRDLREPSDGPERQS